MIKVLESLSSILSFAGVLFTYFVARHVNVFVKENKKIKIKSKKGEIINLYGVVLAMPIIVSIYQYLASKTDGLNKAMFMIISILFPVLFLIILASEVWRFCKNKIRQIAGNDTLTKIKIWGTIVINFILYIILVVVVSSFLFITYGYINTGTSYVPWEELTSLYFIIIIAYLLIGNAIGRYDEKYAKKVSISYRDYGEERKVYTEMNLFNIQESYIIYGTKDSSVRNIIPLDKVENIKIYYK